MGWLDIFDPGDPYIESDAVFGVKESLLAEFKRVEDPALAKQLGFEGRSSRWNTISCWLANRRHRQGVSGPGEERGHGRVGHPIFGRTFSLAAIES